MPAFIVIYERRDIWRLYSWVFLRRGNALVSTHGLVFELSAEVFAVEAGDVGEGN